MSSDYDSDDMLDRLIDGELGHDERRRVLAALETSVDGWRRCALGFVEAQTLRGELRRFVAESAAPAHPAVPATTPVVHPARNVGGQTRGFRGAWLATAASLAAAFGLGWRLGAPRATSPLAEAPRAVRPELAPAPLGSSDAVTLVLNDSRGAQHRVEVPLVDAQALGGDLAQTPAWSLPAAVRRSLDERGIDLKTRRRYAPIYFEQQNRVMPMVVPVDDAYVAPAARTVF